MSSQTDPGQASSPALSWTQVTAFSGAAIAAVYAAGFVVANTYYGAIWLIDPSLLQVRYAGAGILWSVYTGSNVLSVYYLMSLWEAVKPDDTGKEAGARRKLQTAVGRWFAGQPVWLRWLLIGPLVLTTVVAILVVALPLTGPFFSFFLLIMLGAPQSEIVLPVLSFWGAVMAMAIGFRLSGIGVMSRSTYRTNPHRILMVGCLVVLHAIGFGRYLYPVVPASVGGGRPLPVRLVISADADSQFTKMVGIRRPVQDSVFLVSAAADAFVVLVPRPSEGGVAPGYCPIMLKADHVVAVHVIPFMNLQDRFSSPSSIDWTRSSPKLGKCF